MNQAWNQYTDDETNWSESWNLDWAQISRPNFNSYNHVALSSQDPLLPSTGLGVPSSMQAQHYSFLPQAPKRGCIELPTAVEQPAAGPELGSRNLLPTSDTMPFGFTSPERLLTDLGTKFEQALDAVQGGGKRKFAERDNYVSGFGKFRLNTTSKGDLGGPMFKKQRLKRSIVRPCLLCKGLKLKCSFGQPCARCIEKSLGQEDLAFTHCLRDHPSEFNPFLNGSTEQDPLVIDGSSHDIGMLCFMMSRIATQSRSPQLFVWAFSYNCHIRSRIPQQRSDMLETTEAGLFWRGAQSQLSRYALQDLDKTFDLRGSSQDLTNKYGRALCMALCLYAWLGAADAKRKRSTRSEKEQVCKAYLSEYIDLLTPRCMPSLSGAIVRNLMWTMCDLMTFPAVPRFSLGDTTLKQMRCEVESAVSAYRKSMSEAISLYSSASVNDCNLQTRFCRNFWPSWDHPPVEDPRLQAQMLSLFTQAKVEFAMWALRPRPSKSLKSNSSKGESNGHDESRASNRSDPGYIKSWLEWLDDAQAMLQEA